MAESKLCEPPTGSTFPLVASSSREVTNEGMDVDKVDTKLDVVSGANPLRYGHVCACSQAGWNC